MKVRLTIIYCRAELALQWKYRSEQQQQGSQELTKQQQIQAHRYNIQSINKDLQCIPCDAEEFKKSVNVNTLADKYLAYLSCI